MNTFEWWLAWRHLKAKKDHAYLSLITYISVIGVALGVAALIVVLSVMNGFSSDLQKRIISSRAHVEVRAISEEGLPNLSEEIKNSDARILGVTPLVVGDVMFLHGERMSGGILKGIDLATANQVLDFQKNLLNVPSQQEGEERKNIEALYLGSELAGLLRARRGEEVTVISPIETVGPFGTIPKSVSFLVKDLSQTGVYEYDASTGYILLPAAQKFFGLGDRVNNFAVKIRNIDDADDVARSINAVSHGRWEAKSWGELNKVLISALKLEKIGMFIVLALAILVASFNILATLHLMVKEKQKEISIMKAMGATDRQIRKIFWYEGALIGTGGTVLGLVLGAIACLALKQLMIPMPGIYYISSLPISPKGLYFILVAAVTLIMTFTATLYPASRAAKVNPVEGISYAK